MKRYAYEFSAAMALYIAVLVASLVYLRYLEEASVLVRATVTLAPIVPCGVLCWVILRQIRRLDELQLRIQFEALAFAFTATALLTFSYGFLQNVGAPQLSWFFVWPLMALTWVIGLRIAQWRYR